MQRRLIRVFCAMRGAAGCAVSALIATQVASSTFASDRDPIIPSPFVAVGPGPANVGVRLTFGDWFFERARDLPSLQMTAFPLGVTEQVDLQLTRVEAFAP